MSTPKINAKNLSYNTTLPPFLARLQASNNNDDRHEYTVARPKKVRTEEDLAEDEPVYYDERTGETLTMKEFEGRENDTAEKDKDGKGEGARGDGSVKKDDIEDKEVTKTKEEKTASIGLSKKRKVGKVIGGSEDEGDVYAKAQKHINSNKKSDDPEKKAEAGPKKPAAGKKKGKKIKLSFGDDE